MFVGKTWVTPLRTNQEPGLGNVEPTGHELELGFKICVKMMSDLQVSLHLRSLKVLCNR